MTTTGQERTWTGPIAVGSNKEGPDGITAGPDGKLWFTNLSRHSIGRITVNGKAWSFHVAGSSGPAAITAGPDRALWFTEASTRSGAIGRITTVGQVTLYNNRSIADPENITAGPDGALWFTNNGNNSIGRITTYTGTGIGTPGHLTAGPDGALWFSNRTYAIGRITTSGTVTNYSGIFTVDSIAAGPDGALWFIGILHDMICRIMTAVTPQIAYMNVYSGPAGTQVTITGSNLAGATAVTFNGTLATIISDTATSLVTQVPAGATTGMVKITTPVGTTTSKHVFVVTP